MKQPESGFDAFAVKTKARYLTHGMKRKAFLLSLITAPALAGCAASFLLAALCAAYGARRVFEEGFFARLIRLRPSAENAAPFFFLAAGVLFGLFYASLRFTRTAAFYYRTDRSQSRPRAFVSLRAGARAFVCDLTLAVKKSGWLLLMLLPAGATAGALGALLRTGLPKRLFYAGAALAAAQLLAGAAGAFLITRRYTLTRYLIYLNPLLPVREAARSSVMLMRGKLLQAAACEIGFLPWRALRLFAPARPFAAAYTGLLSACLCEALYAGNKTES